MQSIAYIPGSNGATNASLMTVQTVRAPLATTIAVNTVLGAPAKFYASMGTPHTFTDPATGETITLISEATAVDFAGSISGSNINIDQIAPGYTDLGSKVGDIIVIRPITEWANNLANLISASHKDDGTIKDDAISSAAMFADSVDPVVRGVESAYDFIASGAILAGLSYGVTLTASLTAGVCYINGIRQTITAVATRTYTASKDTYVDALYNANGTATIVYQEVANNAASPALAANSIRLGIVVTGANIANVGSINQGQLAKLLPVTSGTSLSVQDSLGNLISPRDPKRTIIGYRQTISDSVWGGTANTPINGLVSMPIKVPEGRKVRISLWTNQLSVDNAAAIALCYVFIDTAITNSADAITRLIGPRLTNSGVVGHGIRVMDLTAGVHTIYTAIASTGGGNAKFEAGVTFPGYLMAELV